MTEENGLNLEAIAEKYNLLATLDVDRVMKQLDVLDLIFEREDLIRIYNFVLTNSKSPDVLIYVISLADRFRNHSTLAVLIDTLLLKNTDGLNPKEKEYYTNVRVMSAKAIANYRDTSAVTPLLYCLNNKDENYKVRFACADALGKIGDKYAVAPLIDVVQDEDEKSVYLRESAASALGMLGDMRAVDPLVSILETKQGIIDKFTFLKERVIEALGKLRLSDNQRVFNALKMTLMDPSAQIRINAIEAIMESEHPESYDVIKGCLLDDDDEVKKNALVALYNLQGRSVLDEIIREPIYSDILKMEAVSMIDEYETDEDAEFAEKFKEELDD
ncbi:HEAT repeat domain-containing protein [bacterium]|mgnify:CR=1 FL=1|nr:HEAT repeat domain-containing protein [bacterium]